ncbi:hypothetical protein L1049_019647 [Liquidambar formosana]|uniref:Uncharacterized protein n=1 Tax=Liquidambar formosana TaxID=63359 RepID=A0AAP0X9C7_LIQFO
MMGVLWVVLMDGMNGGSDEDGTVVVVLPQEMSASSSAAIMGKGKKQRGKPSKRENENGDIRSAKRWTTATNPVQAICEYCKKSFDTLEEWRKHTCKLDKKKGVYKFLGQ